MISRWPEFQTALSDVDCYFEFLERQLGGEVNALPAVDGRGDAEHLAKILKASAILIIYNLVEATVRTALMRLYETINEQRLSAANLRKELVVCWVAQRLRGRELGSTDTLIRQLEDIVTDIITDHDLEFDIDSRISSFSGNVDARKIRELALAHGVPLPSNFESTPAGSHLFSVKNRRNSLAHGNESFAECGRGITLQDLQEMKDAVVSFLTETLACFATCINDRAYTRPGDFSAT